MHRIAVEILIATVVAAVMASLVLIAGTVIAASTEPLMPSLTSRLALCTVSDCKPPELGLTVAVGSDPAEAAPPRQDED